ncbi:MAG: FHA domain-containing protein [Armatimonadetes bacterium]|nr:FHA domain-containing protein [Armatimonadota bacterium]
MTDNTERTVVNAEGPAADATVALAPGSAPAAVEAPDRTQMAVSVECPVCHTTNPPGETFCGDCGFILTGTPGESAEEEEAPLARLTDLSGREFPIHPGRNSVGRQGTDVLLADPSVSRQHAAITLEERCTVEDLGSTNGTKVNGQRLAPHEPFPLADGDELAFGAVALRVALPEGVGVNPEERAADEGRKAEAEGEGAPTPARLVAEETGTEYPIPVGTTTVGRRSVNQIAFGGDWYVSGRHAEITFDGETLSLTDIGSTNGTLVNDDRLAPNVPIALHDGDLVIIGQQRLRVRIEPVPAEEAQAPESEESPAEGPRDEA